MLIDIVGRLVAIVAGGLVVWGCSALIIRSLGPAHRRQEGQKWAWRHQAFVAPRWVPAVDAQLRANKRTDLAGVFLFTVVLIQMPTSLKAYAACLVTLPVVLASVRGLTATRRTQLPAGARVARLRELTLSDYVPRSSRILMWAGAVAGSAATLYLGIARSQPLTFASTLLLLLAPLSVEVAGNRLARQPEPAEDSAHLYWQDAFRSDLLRSASAMTAASGCLLCLIEPGLLASTIPSWGATFWWALGAAILALMLLDSRGLRDRPAAYMRSRLWPMLTPDQVMRSGDPVPSSGATP